MPCEVSSTGMKMAKLAEVSVRKHHREVEQRERPGVGPEGGQALALPPAPARSISGTRRSRNHRATSPGTAIIGDQCSPSRSIVGAKKSGAIAMPIEPPVMCTDIA